MSIVDRAISYAQELSFAVFPVHGVNSDGSCTCGKPDCANIGKHPATRNGLKDASTDPNRIQNMFASSRPYNVAVATGPESNIFVVDVDGMPGETALASLVAANSPLPKTLTSLTGRGRHLIFRHPGVKIKTRSSKLGEKLDVRGDGGYIVIPPSLHKSGVYYSWDESASWDIAVAPNWLIDLVKDSPSPIPLILPVDRSSSPGSWSSDDVQAMLDHIDPDISHDDWRNVGMALHHEGFPMAMFNNWSARGSKYPGVREIEKRWKSFHPGGGITIGTLVNMAQLSGWVGAYPDDAELLEIGRAAAINLFSPSPTITPPAGIIAETIDWIIANAHLPQPELALLNTIAALGAVFGRRYRSPMDTRTNVYMVGLAGTGSGKGHSKKLIKSLMLDAGLMDYLGGEAIVSGAGLLTDVFLKPAQVMHLDEFGMLLEAIMDKRGASHLKIASKIITELYSNSSEKYIGAQYADKKTERTIISNPNLCIFGISTMEKYVASLSKDAIASGELNRFIVCRVQKDRPARRRGVSISPAPEWLLNSWKSLKPTQALNSGLIDPTLITVDWPGLQDRIDDMADFEDNQIELNQFRAGALWGRYRENVIKVAMIFAIARNQIKPEISATDLDIAENIIKSSVHFMLAMVDEHLTESQHEKDCNDILQIIKTNHEAISKTALCRFTKRMDSRTRESAIASLIERGDIIPEIGVSPQPGRKPISYRIRV